MEQQKKERVKNPLMRKVKVLFLKRRGEMNQAQAEKGEPAKKGNVDNFLVSLLPISFNKIELNENL